MRKATSFIAMSTLAIGAMSFIPARAADPAPTDAGRVGTPSGTIRTETNTSTDVRTGTNNNNNAAVAAPDADDIRKTIADVTEEALTKGDFHKLTKNFVDADYDRVKNFKAGDNFAQLDGRIESFQKDWKSKYNEDFGYSRQRNDVLGDQFARITQGEIGEARTAGGKEMPSAEPQNVKGGSPEDLKKSGVATPDANSNKTFGGDTNKEPGRNVASFILQGQAKASASIQPGEKPAAQMEMNKELAVPLIHELPDSWKIDLPDNIDGQKLHDNLLKHLTMVDENRANWPADKNEAYREVTRHVLMAIMESGT